MLIDLVKKPETDIIAALDDKSRRREKGRPDNFGNDCRVHNALLDLGSREYDLSSIVAQWTILDDSWVKGYLMECVGDYENAAAVRSAVLSYYDQFMALSPVARGFAFCKAIECAQSVVELDSLLGRLDDYVLRAKSPDLNRMYAPLQRIARARRPELERKDAYNEGTRLGIMYLVADADELIRRWEISEGVRRYNRAAEFAEWALRDEKLAAELTDRLHRVVDEMMGRVKPA